MTDTMRVLFVEDSEDDCFLVRRVLEQAAMTVDWARVDTRDGFLAALAGRPWDVVLSDHSMPHFSSLEALRLLRNRQLDIPFIIVSGTIGEEQAVAAMRAGASDYVLKGNLTRLPEAIAREQREREKRDRAREAQEALEEAERQLRHAQKLEAVGRLAGGIAHDFNNLLTAILGFTELALDDLPPDAPLRRDLDQVVLAAERASQLTRQILTFCRRDDAIPAELDLGSTTAELIPMLRRLLGADIEIDAAVSSDTPTIVMDRGQLEQVLMNLAVNARDAMPDGGHLSITARSTTLEAGRAGPLGVAAGRYAALSVRDTGHGMDDDTRARVFDPFFTTKEVGKGTGLGLSTVYGLVKHAGGAIELETAPGAGTTFTILLPAAAAAAAAAPESVPSATHTGTEGILLVETDTQVRRLATAVLENAGYTVTGADSRDRALSLAPALERVDLLLTNIVMPGGTGRDLAGQVACHHPGVRVLFVSGHAVHDALPVHVTENPLALLRKPFSPSSLLSAVRACLDAASKEPR